MPTSKFDAIARCPFYITSQNQPPKITCEGIDGTEKIWLGFRKKIDKSEYMQDYCVEDYESCQIYRAVMEKYEGDGR